MSCHFGEDELPALSIKCPKTAIELTSRSLKLPEAPFSRGLLGYSRCSSAAMEVPQFPQVAIYI